MDVIFDIESQEFVIRKPGPSSSMRSVNRSVFESSGLKSPMAIRFLPGLEFK